MAVILYFIFLFYSSEEEEEQFNLPLPVVTHSSMLKKKEVRKTAFPC